MSELGETGTYRVLARKYRPTHFGELIGQDALVRTLTNAIEGERLAHAFMLTGVRGVGKTTTARIIARALNCIGPDGRGGPTPNPCGECVHCRAIGEDRHQDVIEMDAASRAGVDEIRELIEGVRYRPVEARYKVYIIDEVHMLSKPAFNALLKTLEEPPPHVKFVLATTEIRKVPVTVLSRCQRFDLNRVDAALLEEHFAKIANAEGAAVEPGALALIARAADGSVRDGLSLLDQAIAHGAKRVTENEVRDMLGLADRAQVFDLFEAVMQGETAAALRLLGRLYGAGADPFAVLQDLLELTHWLTRLKVIASAGEEKTIPETERVRGRSIAEKLSVPQLSRCWQALLKGLDEARRAPRPLIAAEMALIRLAHLSQLPTPAEALRALAEVPPRPAAGPGAPPSPPAARAPSPAPAPSPSLSPSSSLGPAAGGAPQAALKSRPEASAGRPGVAASPRSFVELAELAAGRREMRLYAELVDKVHLVRFEPGLIEFRPAEGASPNLANRLREKLFDWTGTRWQTVISKEAGQATLKRQEAEAREQKRLKARETPAVKDVLAVFPDAEIRAVRPRSRVTPADEEGDERP